MFKIFYKLIMKEFIKKHWALLGFILAFLIDQNTGIVELVTSNVTLQNLIKGLGAIFLAYFWKTENNTEKKSRKGIGTRPNDRGNN